MTTVLASTDALPELADALARRRAVGLDRYDEWWEGVYRVVTGPSPEHGRIALRLGGFLDRLAVIVGLVVSVPVNIGRDKDDARVPDVGVFDPATPRTSPAFLSSAELVVEILSPDERAGAKLDFYARWGVREYLEVDMAAHTVRLLRHDGGVWRPVEVSAVLPFRLTGARGETLLAVESGDAYGDAYTVDWPRG